MSFEDLISFAKSIIHNIGINWVIAATLIIIIVLVSVAKWILSKYKKEKRAIKENLSEFINDVKNLKTSCKVAVVIVMVLLCVCIFLVVYWVRKPNPYQEIAIVNNKNEVIYPIGVDILNKEVVEEFTFFTYKTSEKVGDIIITYPVLYKWKEGYPAERVSEGACPHFEIVKNSIIYLNSTLEDLSHGQLYVARPDGLNKRILEEEIYDFSVDKEYIYFTYCFDTVGVGLNGNALHRMDLDGGNIVTVSYGLSSPHLQGNHYEVRIEDGWAIYKNYKIEMGNPANGLEKVVLLEDTDADWIYYTSNRLIKAKPDGSEQIILDDIDDFWYQIDKIENGIIYYQKGNNSYKIDINGNNKSKMEK